MMVSAAVANALQDTMNAGGNPKLVFTPEEQGGCFNHIMVLKFTFSLIWELLEDLLLYVCLCLIEWLIQVTLC